MPPLSDVDAMVSAARSRNIRLSFIIQNFSQLNDVYGKEKAETIRGNCGNTIYLLSTELAALEEISKMCGEVKSKKDDKTDSRPLVTVTDLQNLKEEEGLILRSRMRPFKTKLMYEHKIEWGMTKEAATYPIRKQQPVKIFDLKAFVEKQREEKINNMLNGNSLDSKMSSPMGMPGGFNPAKTTSNNGFNVDDLVKRIDAKIAELEEEERKEKEEQQKKQNNKENNKENNKKNKNDTNLEDKEIIVSDYLEKTENSKNIKQIENEEIDDHDKTVIDEFIDTKNEFINNEEEMEDEITDDQFFDDFFYDEED
jgi:type IV secretion system protein VirD4